MIRPAIVNLVTPADRKIIYLALYLEGQKVLDQLNPCQIKNGECAAGPGKLKSCCGGCKHLGPQGCTVESLMCKVWLCFEASSTERGRRAQDHLSRISSAANTLGLRMGVRASYEDNYPGVEP